MTLAVGAKLGPYEILAPLGAGGMGEVFRARDTRLGRQVAVKILPDAVAQDPRRMSRFETEARALAAVSHPNILAIHDFGHGDGRLYAVTELLDGETLRDRMSGEPIPWRKAAELAAAIADGLASAHAAGIVHRDLKPENVFLTSDGRLKILDFGLAKATEAVSADAITLTLPPGGAVSTEEEVVGTLSYMAPEQLRGLRVDGRTDLFALGCVLFEMLSGKRPFVGATPADTMSAILHGEPSSLEGTVPELPPALERIVSRCLEKRPEDRYDTAHDLALSLRSISSEMGPATRRLPKARRRRRPWLLAAAVATAAVAVVGAFVKWPRTIRPDTSGRQIWGPPRQITSAPGWEAEPAISPDGTLVAFSSNASGKAEIWIVDSGGGEALRLTGGPGENRKPAWFPDGRAITFASGRDGGSSVWKISRLGGSPTLILEDADSPAVSPDGTRVAFSRRGPGGQSRIWVVSLESPSSADRLTGDEDGEWGHNDPAWSPDGKLICYASFRDLWMVPASGGKPWILTPDGKGDREPVFSPDGAYVFFSSLRVNPQSIWRVSTSGGTPARILPGTGTQNHPSLSRDDHRLVFSTLAEDRDVVVADRKTGAICRIASSRNDDTPAIAPDGSAVAYCSDRLGTYDLWLENLEAGCSAKKPPLRLTNLNPGPNTPAFSPDGRCIAFFRPFQGHRDLWVLPLGGGAPAPLVEGTGDKIHPSYSPDGTQLAFVSNRAGHDHLWVLPIRNGRQAGEPWRLTEGDVTDRYPVWSPEGRRIAFRRNEDIWIVEARPGAVARQVTTGTDTHHLAWEPGGKAVLVSGMFGTPFRHLRHVDIASGTSVPVTPELVQGNRDSLGYLSLSRDGRFLATEITQLKGNLWITAVARDGR